MNIETKFDVGDTVWIMEDNKPTEKAISKIMVFAVLNSFFGEDIELSYRLLMTKTPAKEHQLFATKDELLDSFRDKTE